MLLAIVRKHPLAAAVVLFAIIMALVKLGATSLVTNFGPIAGIAVIALILGIYAIVDRRS
jgi:hypothetical protein